jgi:hypothetical protein
MGLEPLQVSLTEPPAEDRAQGSRRAVFPLSWSLFVLLLAAALALPYAVSSGDLADALTRSTVRVSLVFYAVAVCLLLVRRPGDDYLLRVARLEWTLGWIAYLIHLLVAFQIYHHGSHAEAVEHVRAASGFGPGIFVSHFFTLVWTLDVAQWWLRPGRHAARPAWVGGLLHAFMAFIVFNAMIVFETGAIRWVGVVLFTVFALLLALRSKLKPAA